MAQLLKLKLSKKSNLKLKVTGKKRPKLSTDINLDLGEAIEFGKKLFKGDKK